MICGNEYEIKIMIDKYNYEKIMLNCKCYNYDTITQTNYYFDTSNYDLYRNGITLRIREIKSGMVLGVKITKPESIDDKVKGCSEYILSIDTEIANKLISGDRDILSEVKELNGILNPLIGYEAKLLYVGNLITERTKFFPISGASCIEVDKNFYLDYIDYEIEWEVEGLHEVHIVEDWIKEHEIPFDESECGKYARFIQRLLA